MLLMDKLETEFMKRFFGLLRKNNMRNDKTVEGNPTREAFTTIINRDFITMVGDNTEIRFTHATSSRFEEDIKKNGLVRPDMEGIVKSLMDDFGVPTNLHSEIKKVINNSAFGMNHRTQFRNNPIYCSPLHEEYFRSTRDYAQAHANGGEFRNVCANAIANVLKAKGLPVKPQNECEPRIVILNFSPKDIIEPMFDAMFVSEFLTCLESFKGRTIMPPGPEVRIQNDVPPQHIEEIISIDRYRNLVGAFG